MTSQEDLIKQSAKDRSHITLNWNKCQKLRAMQLSEYPAWFEEAEPILKKFWDSIQLVKYPILGPEQKKWMNVTGWRITELYDEMTELGQNCQVLDLQVPSIDFWKKKRKSR